MKQIYPLLFAAVLTTGCSKDVFKRYDKRIIGTWELVDVDNRGIGGDQDRLPFRGGTFTFSGNGDLTYIDPETGTVFNGDWNLDRLDNNDDEVIRVLSIHAVDFNTQAFKSELFEDVRFTGTNRFNAFIYSGLHVYVFRFRRK
ncbi:MAG: hypothetical protein ABWZ25_05240 [Chitinophagaceae bacterium]